MGVSRKRNIERGSFRGEAWDRKVLKKELRDDESVLSWSVGVVFTLAVESNVSYCCHGR